MPPSLGDKGVEEAPPGWVVLHYDGRGDVRDQVLHRYAAPGRIQHIRQTYKVSPTKVVGLSQYYWDPGGMVLLEWMKRIATFHLTLGRTIRVYSVNVDTFKAVLGEAPLLESRRRDWVRFGDGFDRQVYITPSDRARLLKASPIITTPEGEVIGAA